MTLLDLFTLFLILVVLAAIPSSSVALVVTRSATCGLNHGIAVSIGVVVGDLIFAALALLGLAALSHWLGAFFTIIKYLAACYLIFYGISLLRHSRHPGYQAGETRKPHLPVSFTAGLLLTLGDIKAIFFYASFFPVFIKISSLSAADVVLLTIVMVVAIGGVKIAYAVLASKMLPRINRRFQQRTKTAAGYLMIGTGGYLATRP